MFSKNKCDLLCYFISFPHGLFSDTVILYHHKTRAYTDKINYTGVIDKLNLQTTKLVSSIIGSLAFTTDVQLKEKTVEVKRGQLSRCRCKENQNHAL